MFDRKKFEAGHPLFFLQILDELLKQAYVPTLVGGAIRDFHLHGSLGHDWDIELSHETLAFDKTAWKALGKTLSAHGKLTFLPYDIIRIENSGYQFEFSPPRIEHYKDDSHGHSNFDAEFNFKLPFHEAVKRRDFSINAVGVRFKSRKDIEVIDPLDGLRHLHEKVLHPCGPNFSKDPVRFLRAFRFKEKLGFQFSPELQRTLEEMDVRGVSPSYLWSEMQKSQNPVSFIETMLREKESHPELRLPIDGEFRDIRKVLIDPSKHESWIIALEWMDVSSDVWREYFSLSSDSSKRLARWAHSSKAFQKILPEVFQGEFETIRETKEFSELFDWYFTTKQLLQKNPDLPLLKMIETYIPEWIHLYRFEAPKDVKHIDPPFRAKYQVWNLCQRL